MEIPKFQLTDGTFEPAIHFAYSYFRHIPKEITTEDMFNSAQKIHANLQKATGYTWGNDHFYIDDICGRPTMKIGFYADQFTFWAVHNGQTIITIDNNAWMNFRSITISEIDDCISNLSKGLGKCLECYKWFPNDKLKSYSYTGIVCKKCYDPSRHLPPDSSG